MTTFYDYLRRLVSLHMVKTFMSIDITNLLNLLARITNWKSLFCITPFSRYTATKKFVVRQDGEIGFFNSPGIHKTKAIFV